MKYLMALVWTTALSLLAVPLQALEPIPLDALRDRSAHWQKKFGRDRDDPQLAPHQIVEIADQMIRYQNPDGGWPKDLDYLALVPEEEVRRLRGTSLNHSTFDNHTTFPQVEYLSQVYLQTGTPRFREAAARGLAYILAEQRPSGGWRGADVDAITYNDGVMTGIMRLLQAISEEAPQFHWVDDTLRSQAAEALDRAIAVTLAAQIMRNGVRTGWCQQHSHDTLLPLQARSYELASVATDETVTVTRYLMGLPRPSAEIVAAVDAAVAWMRDSAIPGIRLERPEIEPVRFENHTATRDVVAVEDPEAPPIWTRFYELETNRPFFCNRDGRVVYTLAEVALERRTGYGWYGHWPQRLLDREYPAWRAALNP